MRAAWFPCIGLVPQGDWAERVSARSEPGIARDMALFRVPAVGSPLVRWESPVEESHTGARKEDKRRAARRLIRRGSWAKGEELGGAFRVWSTETRVFHAYEGQRY